MPFGSAFTLVTGGTGVVGAGVVRRLLSAGRRVAITYSRNNAAVDLLRQQCEGEPDQLVAIAAELSTGEGVEQLIGELRSAELNIGALVHCAALVDHTTTADLSADRFSEVLAVNVTSAFLLVRHLAQQPELRAAVLLSSIAADFTGMGSMAYEASKGAVNSLTRALAAELAPRVRVNAVAPGVVNSHRTADDPTLSCPAFIARIPDRSLVDADQLAEVIEFLVSERSRLITGQVVRIDGGMSVRLF